MEGGGGGAGGRGVGGSRGVAETAEKPAASRAEVRAAGVVPAGTPSSCEAVRGGKHSGTVSGKAGHLGQSIPAFCCERKKEESCLCHQRSF